MSKLDELIKNVNKKFKTDIMGNKDVGTFKASDFIQFPSPVFNYLFHSPEGLPTGIILEVMGEFSSSKSTFAQTMVGIAQKKFIKEWQEEIEELADKDDKTSKARYAELLDNGHRKCLYLDSEMACDLKYMTFLGVDVEDCVYIRPQQESAEELLQIVLDAIDTGCIGLVVIDSIPMLTSKMQMDKDMEGKTFGGISAPLTVFANKVLPKLKQHNCTLISINQMRDVLNSMVPGAKSSPGGKAWKHAHSIQLEFRKGRSLDDRLVEIAGNTESFWGSVVEIAVRKNKVSPFDRRMAKTSNTRDIGINHYNDSFLMLVGLNIVNQSGAWYSYTSDSGEEFKWQGKPNVIQAMKDNSDLYAELRRKLDKEILGDV